jgi:HEAT repeat protein
MVLLCAVAPAAEAPKAGKPVGELRGRLVKGKTELERLNAAKALDALVPAKQLPDPRRKQKTPDAKPVAADVVAALLPGLEDSAGSVRYVCRQALGRGGQTAIAGLLATLKSAKPDARSYAADALADMAQYTDAPALPLEQAVPALTKALADKHYAVRVSACLALKHFGPRAESALAKLIRCLNDKEWSVAEAAVQAVAAVDPSGKKSVPPLAKLLRGRGHELREQVCQELGRLGPKAKAAVPALIKLLDADKDNWFAGKAATDALMQIAAYDRRKTPEDPAADMRPRILAAIARSASTQKTPFVRQDRLTALFVPGHLTCPMGPEVLPALPYALETLKAWMHQPQNPWVPRPGLVNFLAVAGVHARPEVVAAVKELLADKTVDQAQGVKQLEYLLKKLEGEGA